jgi:hypothetical protein
MSDDTMMMMIQSNQNRNISIISIICALILLKRKIRNRLYITNQILLEPSRSPYQRLLANGDDSHFIHLMGVSIDVFRDLLNEITPLFDIKEKGRWRRLNPAASLGLALHYLNSTMKQKSLQLIFGAGPATLCRTLKQTLDILLIVLKNMHAARIRWPSRKQCEKYAAMVQEREDRLENVFGFVDGVYFYVQEPSDPDYQRSLYNAWKQHTTTCANVFLFVASGEIGFAAFNCPGSWHDSRTAEPLYNMLRYHTDEPFCVVADSAFSRLNDLNLKIIKPLRVNERFRDHEHRQRCEAISAAVVNVRQAAEWGMRALQGSFSRLLTRLDVDEQKRGRVIELCIHLYNLRCRRVGLNQIRNVFKGLKNDQEWAEIAMNRHERAYNIQQ